MKFISLATVALLFAAQSHAKPNILLVIADDMGLDASNCYEIGSQQANMPILEAMCAKGKVFNNAYAAPTCSPTRASIMTGRHGFRTGIGGVIPKRGNSAGLSSDENSLFDALAISEYQTAVIGKWHLAGSNDGLNHPSTLGVKEYFGLYSGGVDDYFSWDAIHNGKEVKVDTYATTALTDHAINWIDEQSSPWFLWLAYNAPHTPFHLPPQELHSAGELPDDENSIKRNPLPYYNAMLEALDTEFGRLLGTLSDEVRENTVIIFIGDNGTPTPISKSIYGNRRNKGSIFQGGTSVPFVVTGPGITAGKTDALVNTTDLFATITSLAGVPTSATDAYDFSPVLAGKAASSKRTFAYAEHFGKIQRKPDVFGWAIRDARYKLVAEDGAEQQLYDMVNDPLEKTNLLTADMTDELSEEVKRLQTAYEELRKKK